MFKTGLVSVTFRGLTPVEIIELCKKTGLSCIEWGSDIHAPAGDEDNLRKIAEMQSEAGISCCSYGTYFRIGESEKEELFGYIDAAKILGTNILRVWCGNKPSTQYSVKQKEALYRRCCEYARIAEHNGVKLCLECHHGTYTESPTAAKELIETVASNSFRMYWQPNQYVTEAENKAAATLLAPITENIHVFNWSGEKKAPLFEGLSAWRNYLAAFEPKGCLLLEFMPDGKPESLAGEVKSLNLLLGG